jgi:hypothetical protein
VSKHGDLLRIEGLPGLTHSYTGKPEIETLLSPEDEYELEAAQAGNSILWFMEKFPVITEWCEWADQHFILPEDWPQRIEQLIWDKSEEEVKSLLVRSVSKIPPLVVPTPLLFSTILGLRRMITSGRIDKIAHVSRVDCTQYSVYAIFVLMLGKTQIRLIVRKMGRKTVIVHNQCEDEENNMYLSEWLGLETMEPQESLAFHPKVVAAWRFPEAEDVEAATQESAMQDEDVVREEAEPTEEMTQEQSGSMEPSGE